MTIALDTPTISFSSLAFSFETPGEMSTPVGEGHEPRIVGIEARVERIVEYKVKGAEVAAGKEVCAVNDGYGYNRFFHALPECGEGKTRAEFSKSRTIIHIPAGSMDKMVAMTSE